MAEPLFQADAEAVAEYILEASNMRKLIERLVLIVINEHGLNAGQIIEWLNEETM